MNASEILREMNKILNLGDLIYGVREQEGEGWEGPEVIRWSELCEAAQEHIEADGPKDRVEIELSELTERIEKLRQFMDTEEYVALYWFDKTLLQDMYQYMSQYANTLGTRVKSWK